MRRSTLIVAIVILLILGLAAYLVMGRSADNSAVNEPAPDTTMQTNDTAPEELRTATEETEKAESGTTITYTDQGFIPSNLDVTAGTTITIRNQSSRSLDFASDDHPAHQDNSELNVGDIEPGQEKTMTLDTKGTWGYHNHDNENDEGRITVN